MTRCTAVLILAVGLSLLTSVAGVHAQVVWPLLPTSGGESTFAQSIDASGKVVGYTRTGVTDTPTVWWPPGTSAYTAEALGSDGAGAANSVNGAAAAGYSQPEDLSTAAATLWWLNGIGQTSRVPLPSPLGATLTSALSINAAASVAGFAEYSSGHTQGVVWNDVAGTYSATVLPALADWTDSGATAMNGAGDIGGYCVSEEDGVQAAVWQKSGNSYTPKVVFAVETAVVTALNDNGFGAAVVGSNPAALALFEGDYYAFELTQPFGATDGSANAINAFDAIAGSLKDPETAATSGREAALWLPTESFWDYVNLDRWLDETDPTLGAQWTLSEVFGLTDSWRATGDGLFDPDGPGGPLMPVERGFVLDVSTVVPEPTGVFALIAAAPLLVPLRRRRRRRT
jgi:hypothetical protein